MNLIVQDLRIPPRRPLALGKLDLLPQGWGAKDGIWVNPIVDRYLVSLERITHVLKTYLEN
jgi:hypothetical protein